MPETLYVSRPLLNGEEVIAWAKQNGLGATLAPEDMHVTVAFSRQPFEPQTEPDPEPLLVGSVEEGVGRSVGRLGPQGAALVLKFDSPELTARWQAFRDQGASWDWPEYRPHVTLSYSAERGALNGVIPYAGPLFFGPEKWTPVDEDWKDKVVEKEGRRGVMSGLMAKVKELLGETLDALNKGAATIPDWAPPSQQTQVPLLKADTATQTVWGWASVIEENGRVVEDVEGDTIEEPELVKAAHDFVSNARAGKVLHKGRRIGRVVESVVLTKELQRALGINLNKVGWLIAMKVDDADVWKRVQSGELRAFSIGGSGIRTEV